MISSSAVNSDLSDIAAALTASIAADGQTPMSGQLKGATGTALAPSFSFIGDTSTGFFSSAVGQIGVAISGVIRLIFDATGVKTPAGALLTQPVGTIVDFAGTAAPGGWLLCYGQAISRTTYASLFSTVGIVYGPGDGATTFNLPDCRGRTGVGKDDMGGTPANRITITASGVNGVILGASGGEQSHILTPAESAVLTYQSVVLDPGHTHQTAAVANNPGNDGVIPGFNVIGALPTTSSTTGITVTTTAPNAGGGAHNNTQPSIIFNKIIFAGA